MKKQTSITRILGWDAAWTPSGTGAWCLIEKQEESWKLRWNKTCPTGEALLQELDEILKDASPELIAIDLPIARRPVRGYREADRATTRAFTRYGCPVHSPTPERPGDWGDQILEYVKRHGMEVMISSTGKKPCVAEVYPHTVCLEILRAGYRLPYKIQRAARLFPDRSAAGRREGISQTVRQIVQAMQTLVQGVPEDVAGVPPLPLRHWKKREDQLDALLCAVAGIGILEGRYLPFGDDNAVIWNPDPNRLEPPNRMR